MIINNYIYGKPCEYYDAEERENAYKDLQDAKEWCRHEWQKELVLEGICPECVGSSCLDGEDENGEDSCYGWMDFGCDGGEMTQRDEGLPNWAEIQKHDIRQRARQGNRYKSVDYEKIGKEMARLENIHAISSQLQADYPEFTARQRATVQAIAVQILTD